MTVQATIPREARFEDIFASMGPALRRVAAIYEADLARRDDLFQEICFAIWRALPSFRGEASIKTFVFRIAHNRGLQHRSRRGVSEVDLDAIAPLADPAPDAERQTVAAERHRALVDAVSALPLGLRQVMTLCLEGLSHGEIAQVVGISEGNVAVRLTRARQALRRILVPEGVS